ncbi:MAG: hypothetical protein AB7G11_05570 [Phycisphaerales bacterium]
MTRIDFAEVRRQVRLRRSDVLAWRHSESMVSPRTALLLESSDDGLAFAWRGEDPPAQDSLIELQVESAGATSAWKRAVVRHSHMVHDNLSIVGVEVLQFREFPPCRAKLPPPNPTRSDYLMIDLKAVLAPSEEPVITPPPTSQAARGATPLAV